MPGSQIASPSADTASTVMPRRASRSAAQTARQGRGLTGWCGAWESEPAEMSRPFSAASRR